jgi:hypothetical protein
MLVAKFQHKFTFLNVDLKKTRTALSYFTQFCIFGSRFSANLTQHENIQIRRGEETLIKSNEILKFKIEEEEALAVQLAAKVI